MTTLTKLTESLIKAGQHKLATELAALRPKDPFQALILRAAIDAVDRYGLTGLEKIKDDLLLLIDGSDAVDLTDMTDLELASDMLSAMQRLEADQKSSAREMVTRLTESMAPILSALLGALVS